MKSIADQLPPEIARQIQPDLRKKRQRIGCRDQLLDQYQGQWIGFVDGKVIASGNSPVTVFHAAEATGLHPFFICVGRKKNRAASATLPFPTTPVIPVNLCR